MDPRLAGESMTAARYLTKSRFKLALECPTKLFYVGKDTYRDQRQGDALLSSFADSGHQVGEFAKLRYPNGLEIKSKGNAAAVEETKQRLSEAEEVTLFEPAIQVGNLLVRIDILVQRPGHFDLIEVKSRSFTEKDFSLNRTGSIGATLRPFVADVAFQTYVLRQAYPQCSINSYLLFPDRQHQCTLDSLNQHFAVTHQGRSVSVAVQEGPHSLAELQQQAQVLLKLVCVDEYVDILLRERLEFPGGSGSLEQVSHIWADKYAKDEKIIQRAPRRAADPASSALH